VFLEHRSAHLNSGGRLILLEEAIRNAREWKKQHYGVDTEVAFDIHP